MTIGTIMSLCKVLCNISDGSTCTVHLSVYLSYVLDHSSSPINYLHFCTLLSVSP